MTTESSERWPSIRLWDFQRLATTEPVDAISRDAYKRIGRVGRTPVREVVANYERDPGRAELLKAARQSLAETEFFSQSPLKRIRLASGLSQAQVAAAMQTTQSHVARIENGSLDARIGTLESYANAVKAETGGVVAAFRAVRNPK